MITVLVTYFFYSYGLVSYITEFYTFIFIIICHVEVVLVVVMGKLACYKKLCNNNTDKVHIWKFHLTVFIKNHNDSHEYTTLIMLCGNWHPANMVNT